MALKGLPDHLLLEQCRCGDDKSFNILFRRYFTKLYKYTRTFIKDEMIAEELVMDVMFSLWQKQGDIVIQGDLGPYLFRSMKNALINHWRKKALQTTSIESPEFTNPSDSRSADYSLSCRELEMRYEEQLKALSPQRKKVFELSRTEQMTYPEIAAQLNLSVKTVENHISSALAFIRKNLKITSDSAFTLFVLFFI